MIQGVPTPQIRRNPSPALQQYFALCDKFRRKPVDAVALCFHYGSSYLLLDKDFSQGDIPPLFEALKGDTTVRSLDLRRCTIGSPGCTALQDLLQFNDTIDSINLSHNDIGENGAQALAAGLTTNTSVQRLFLRGNRIGMAGATALVDVVRGTMSLRLLDLSNNDLRWDAVLALRRAVEERVSKRARVRSRARRTGQVNGAATIKVRDVDVVLTGNLVMQEVTSSIMHGTGLLLSAIGAVPLLRVARDSKDPFHFWGVTVYTAALLAMYLSTTLGHSFFFAPRASAVFKALDRSVIYVMIAGTYTPFLLVNTRRSFGGQVMLVFVWGTAVCGVLLSNFSEFWARKRFLLYLVVGCCSIVAYRSILTCVHLNGLLLLTAGCLFLLIGLATYGLGRMHISYFLSLVGTAFHYFAVHWYVTPCKDPDDLELAV